MKESCINVMIYPHAQDSPTSKMKPVMRPEKKNPKDLLIYLKEFVGCLQAQVLVDINEKVVHSQPLSLHCSLL